ncbi:MAG: response regulator [Candidatus Latescibacterota bacterium]
MGAHSRGRILVVDDEESVGRLLQQWLTLEGYEAAYVPGFAQVRKRLMAGEAFDLVTLDIMMPDTDGMEVLAWLRQHYPDVGVVMATALGDMSLVIQAMRQGAVNYLLKPFDLELVAQEVSRAMERQHLLAENRAYQERLEELVEERTAALRQAQAHLERQVRELEGRDRLVRFQMEAHTVAEAHGEVLAVALSTLPALHAVLYQAAAGQPLQVAMAASAEGVVQADPGGAAADEASAAARALASGRIESDGLLAAVPLLHGTTPLGVLQVAFASEAGDDVLNSLWRLAGESALVLRSACLAEELACGQLSFDDLDDSA